MLLDSERRARFLEPSSSRSSSLRTTNNFPRDNAFVRSPHGRNRLERSFYAATDRGPTPPNSASTSPPFLSPRSLTLSVRRPTIVALSETPFVFHGRLWSLLVAKRRLYTTDDCTRSSWNVSCVLETTIVALSRETSVVHYRRLYSFFVQCQLCIRDDYTRSWWNVSCILETTIVTLYRMSFVY